MAVVAGEGAALQVRTRTRNWVQLRRRTQARAEAVRAAVPGEQMHLREEVAEQAP